MNAIFINGLVMVVDKNGLRVETAYQRSALLRQSFLLLTSFTIQGRV